LKKLLEAGMNQSMALINDLKHNQSISTTFITNSSTLIISSIPVGSIHYFPAKDPPSGFLKLNGQIISRTNYSDLWNFVQSSGNLASSEITKQTGQFGPGDGISTFSLPDYRGLFLRSWDDGRNIDSGRIMGSFQESQNMAHNHSIIDSGHNHGISDPGHEHYYSYPQSTLAQAGNSVNVASSTSEP
jgi:microcystin-dependent protein